MIPPAFLQDLLSRVDVVELVGRHVQLKRGGANWSGLCPFHAEKSPSFTVSPSKQFYHCFGCGAHGNAISFVMQYQGLGYVEAGARREQTTLRVAREAAESKLASALVERDRALAVAQQNYQAWSNARSQILQLQREVADAKGSASAGWVAALVGTVGGAILGAAAAEPAAPVASAGRRRSNRRA